MYNMTESSNQEVTVRCPAEYPDGTECGEEIVSRALHLHVLRKNDEAHGDQGDIPPDLDLHSAEQIGEQTVEVDYPDDREREESHRECPYCKRVFSGKQSLEIHFGHVVGRKNHPKDREEFPDAEDCPTVKLDERENVVDRTGGVVTPSKERRRADQLHEKLLDHADELRSEEREEEAEIIEKALEEVAE